jgi:hypothetical protein
MNASASHAALALITLASAAGSSSAAIVSVSGQALQIGPPPSAAQGLLTGLTAFAWDEQQNINVAGVVCDEIANPGTSFTPTFGAVSGQINSHFIHFEDIAGITVQGSVTFDGPIVGVIWKNALLDLTDGSLGAGATAYPTGYFTRGLAITLPSWMTTNANVLTFDLGTLAPVGDLAQLRVLTAVPAPGAAAVFGIAGLAAARLRR